MPSIHSLKKDKDTHEDAPRDAVEVLARELAGTKAEHNDRKSDNQSKMRRNRNNASLENYSRLSRQLEKDFKASNEIEHKENLKKQQERHELTIEEMKTAYKNKSTASKLKARSFRSQNLKDAAHNAGSMAQAYLREANFLMQRLGSMVYNKGKVHHDIDGNFKSSGRYDSEANRLNAAADKAAEAPIEDDD